MTGPNQPRTTMRRCRSPDAVGAVSARRAGVVGSKRRECRCARSLLVKAGAGVGRAAEDPQRGQPGAGALRRQVASVLHYTLRASRFCGVG